MLNLVRDKIVGRSRLIVRKQRNYIFTPKCIAMFDSHFAKIASDHVIMMSWEVRVEVYHSG